MKRRSVLASAIGLGALALYTSQRGLRYPRITFEPRDVDLQLETPAAIFKLTNLINVKEQKNSTSEALNFRAYTPEPKLEIKLLASSTLKLNIHNVSPEAKLNVLGKNIKLVDESIAGINRKLTIESSQAQTIQLDWQLNLDDGFDFALLGDTGGGSELNWSIKRSHELGAKFLLHLGDFHYTEGEYDLAIEEFKIAPLPCYISIGNHDFNDNGLVYQQFLDQIGPFNSWFTLNGTRFINLDTALNFLPAGAGHRGDFMHKLVADNRSYSDQVIFTHRPLSDPRPNDDHQITGFGEVDWVGKMARAIGAKNYFNGHVHHSAELDTQGLHQYTVGEGLGHEDLVLQKQVAQLLIGRVQTGKAVSYQWRDLNMPWSAHTSPTHETKLRKDQRSKQLQWYKNLNV